MRNLCVALCLSTLMYTISPAAMAQDDSKSPAAPMTDQEDGELASRAAQSPELEQFSGGDALGVMISLLVIVALVAIIYFFIVKANYRSHPAPLPQPAPQAKPQVQP